MKKIIVSTESGSDLPKEVVEKYGIYVVPMHVIMNDTDYEDGTFPVDKVFEYYETTGRVPSTAATNVNEYDEFFRMMQTAHPDSIIYHFTYSSKASSTHQNASISVKKFKNIFIIDTLSVSGGCTAMIVEACELIKEKGESVTDYAAFANELQSIAERTECNFIPNTLEYLKAGGRVSNAAYLAATILNLKPKIVMTNGELIATKRFRGKIAKWVDKFFSEFLDGVNFKKNCLYLMYGKGLPREVMDRMVENAKAYGFKSWMFVMTGCVISCHGGKGAIGLAGIRES